MIAILTAKLVSKCLRIMGKGATTLPGRIALKMKYNILNTLSRGVKIICVTGTNGKTTSCAMLEYALKSQNISYFINKSGANMISGVATSFIENSNLLGRCKREYAILECDENSFPEISRYLDAEVVAVTNIFRDQLDRYGEMDNALNSIVNAISNMPETVLVLNADCPITYSISEKCDNRIITFGINGDYKLKTADDIAFCPVCSSELLYKSRVYSRLGDYFCPRCAYKRVFPDVFAEDINISEDGLTEFFINVNGKRMLASSPLGGIYNVYNYCCAAAVLDTLGIDATAALCGFSGAFGRMERFFFGGREILLLLVKNPVGIANCISYVSSMKNGLNMVFALNDNEADGIDVSWIWDASFVKLKNSYSSVYTIGKRAFDMALRLKYDGLENCKIIDGEKWQELIDIIKSDNSDFVIFANYTAMMNMRRHFIKAFGGKEFWE